MAAADKGIYTRADAWTWTATCAHTHSTTCIKIHVHTCLHTNTRTHTHTHVHNIMHTHTHVHNIMHTHTHTVGQQSGRCSSTSRSVQICFLGLLENNTFPSPPPTHTHYYHCILTHRTPPSYLQETVRGTSRLNVMPLNLSLYRSSR